MLLTPSKHEGDPQEEVHQHNQIVVLIVRFEIANLNKLDYFGVRGHSNGTLIWQAAKVHPYL